MELTILHALDCKKFGLITALHNKLNDEVADLTGKAFTPAHIPDDPKLFSGRSVRQGEAKVMRK